jgi:DNA repair photolyase
MKEFNGKAIRMPKGKAGEYAKYSCNFYVGCSNGCEYCYLKKGRGKKILGGDVPTLKKCFKDENHALQVFEKELQANLPELRKHGLFFSFTTDPLIEETRTLTLSAVRICVKNFIPVKILTKDAAWLNSNFSFGETGFDEYFWIEEWKKYVAIGFTLTGHDELEPNASTNAERIEAIRKLHEAGFKTWASIEPIISFRRTMVMMRETYDCCDLWKVGLLSGGNTLEKEDFRRLIRNAITLSKPRELKIYFKDSLLKTAGINRENLPNSCVSRDYNMFKQ